MNFTTTIKYQEGYLPTPRSRKLRYKECEEFVSTEIKEITKEEAPVAFTHGLCSYRLYNGILYAKAHGVMCCSGKHLKLQNDIIGQLKVVFKESSIFYGFKETDTKDKMIKKAEDYASNYLIIDGEAWEIRGEPRYQITTFGLGNNHGGTSLDIAVRYNANISSKAYFNAFEREKAMEEALKTANMRGDTESIETIKNSCEIKVLIPSAVKCNPKLDHYE